MAAVLLDENGEARCKIGNSGILSSERFGDFVERHPETESALGELDALRECDESDELYAGVVLNPEDIQIAGFPPRASWSH